MKAIKILAAIYGILLIICGLAAILAPEKSAELVGFSSVSTLAAFFMGLAGITWISLGVWAVAAVRDPAKNILIVKLLITKAWLSVAGMVYFIIRDYASFSDIWWVIAVDGVFGLLFLIAYPWKSDASGG